MPPDKPAEYVATEPLYLYNPASGTVPQLARRAGQPVTARALAKNPQWRGKVRRVDLESHQAAPAATPGRPGVRGGKPDKGATS